MTIGSKTITVYNLTGHQVFEQEIQGDRILLPSKNWSAGTYIVKILDKDSNSMQKLIVR